MSDSSIREEFLNRIEYNVLNDRFPRGYFYEDFRPHTEYLYPYGYIDHNLDEIVERFNDDEIEELMKTKDENEFSKRVYELYKRKVEEEITIEDDGRIISIIDDLHGNEFHIHSSGLFTITPLYEADVFYYLENGYETTKELLNAGVLKTNILELIFEFIRKNERLELFHVDLDREMEDYDFYYNEKVFCYFKNDSLESACTKKPEIVRELKALIKIIEDSEIEQNYRKIRELWSKMIELISKNGK